MVAPPAAARKTEASPEPPAAFEPDWLSKSRRSELKHTLISQWINQGLLPLRTIKNNFTTPEPEGGGAVGPAEGGDDRCQQGRLPPLDHSTDPHRGEEQHRRGGESRNQRTVGQQKKRGVCKEEECGGHWRAEERGCGRLAGRKGAEQFGWRSEVEYGAGRKEEQ